MKTQILFIISLIYILLPSEIKSNIIYTDINPDFTSQFITSSTNSVDPIRDIDMNNDGTNEFSFRYDYFSSDASLYLHLDVVPFNNPDISIGGIDRNPPYNIVEITQFDSGVLIDNTHTYFAGKPSVFLHGYYGANGTEIIGFKGKSNKYIGVKFKIGNNIHYGWIEVSLTNSYFFTIHGYAYEDTPNTPIIAGKKSSSQSISVSSININFPNNVDSVKVGQTLNLTATVLPNNATNNTITWSVVSNNNSLSINPNGVVTGLVIGYDTIKAMANDGSGVFDKKIVKVYDNTSSIKELQQFNLELYPNPSTDIIYINNNYIGDVYIYDNNGKQVISIIKNIEKTINIESLQNGYYFINIINDNKIYNSNFIKD